MEAPPVAGARERTALSRCRTRIKIRFLPLDSAAPSASVQAAGWELTQAKARLKLGLPSGREMYP